MNTESQTVPLAACEEDVHAAHTEAAGRPCLDRQNIEKEGGGGLLAIHLRHVPRRPSADHRDTLAAYLVIDHPRLLNHTVAVITRCILLILGLRDLPARRTRALRRVRSLSHLLITEQIVTPRTPGTGIALSTCGCQPGSPV